MILNVFHSENASLASSSKLTIIFHRIPPFVGVEPEYKTDMSLVGPEYPFRTDKSSNELKIKTQRNSSEKFIILVSVGRIFEIAKRHAVRHHRRHRHFFA